MTPKRKTVKGFLSTSMGNNKKFKRMLLRVSADKIKVYETHVKGTFKTSVTKKLMLEADLGMCCVEMKEKNIIVASAVEPLSYKGPKPNDGQWRYVLRRPPKNVQNWFDTIRTYNDLSFQLHHCTKNESGTSDMRGKYLLEKLFSNRKHKFCSVCDKPWSLYANIETFKMICGNCCAATKERDGKIKSILMDRTCWSQDVVSTLLH